MDDEMIADSNRRAGYDAKRYKFKHYKSGVPIMEERKRFGKYQGFSGKRYPWQPTFKYPEDILMPADDRNSDDGDKNDDDDNYDSMPLLTDQDSWTYWRAMIREAMMSKDELNHFATYLYCKIRN